MLTAIDLFSGCGGLSCGLKSGGFQILGSVEKEECAARIYSLNHPEVPMRCEDIQDVDPSKWMHELGLRKGKLSLLAGCPPCQGFSSLRTKNGSRRNRDSRNSLAVSYTHLTLPTTPYV